MDECIRVMKIRDVMARRIWDSRGQPTVEVEVINEDGTSGIGIAPAGASRGTREAVELRDGGHRFNGLDVQQAIAGVEREIAPELVGRDPREQAGVDAMLVALDGAMTGSAAEVFKNQSALGPEAETFLGAMEARTLASSFGLGGLGSVGTGEPVLAHCSRSRDVQAFMPAPVYVIHTWYIAAAGSPTTCTLNEMPPASGSASTETMLGPSESAAWLRLPL